MPFCPSAQLTDFTGLGATHVVGSRSVPEPSRRGEHATCPVRIPFPIVASSEFCPKTLAVRECDDSEPRVTTLLSSYALRSKLGACFRSSCRPTQKHRRASECTSPSLCGQMARRCHAPWQSSSLQDLRVVLSPPLGCIQGSVHCLSQFPTHDWLLYICVLVWHSHGDSTHCVTIEVSSTHVCDGNQERVFKPKIVYLVRNTE